MSFLKRAEKSGGKFLNPVPTTIGGLSMALKILPRYLSNKAETDPKTPPGPFHTDTSVYATAPASGLRVTWFGHSSTLLEIDGVRLLIDPIWEQRASPVQWAGPKRFFPPTMKLEDMPTLDGILISHNHYDHLGAHTLRKLAKLPCAKNAKWVTSLGVGKMLHSLGVADSQIQELDWTESTEIPGAVAGAALRLTALPARHFSGRGILDRFTTLWSAFVIQGSKHRVYFGADSGWWDGIADFATEFGPFDLTMLEIGAFDPMWAAIHLGPENAVWAFEAMGGADKGGILMPIHWGLFNLALHAWRQPIELLELTASQGGVPLWSPEPGVPSEIEAPFVADWWRAPAKR